MASLVSAQANMDVDHPTVHATGAKASARSSVEIKDSCNCFKFCFPCWSKKTEKQSRTDREATAVARKAMTKPHPEYNDISHPSVFRRSPGIENLATVRSSPAVENVAQSITINVHCDHSPGTSPVGSSPLASSSSLSSIHEVL